MRVIADQKTVMQRTKTQKIIPEEDKQIKLKMKLKKMKEWKTELKINRMSKQILEAKSRVSFWMPQRAELPPRGGKRVKLLKVSVSESTVSAQSKRRAVQGIISSIDGSVITLVHQIQRDRTYQLLFFGATIIQTKSEKSASSSASLVPGIRIVAVGDLNSSGQIVAKRIKIIPGKATGIFKKNPLSTQSATISATPGPIPDSTTSAAIP